MIDPKDVHLRVIDQQIGVGVGGWKTVALADQATVQSHQARWAAAEALLMMALPHVETEGDDSLAHEIRRHLNTDTKEGRN